MGWGVTAMLRLVLLMVLFASSAQAAVYSYTYDGSPFAKTFELGNQNFTPHELPGYNFSFSLDTDLIGLGRIDSIGVLSRSDRSGLQPRQIFINGEHGSRTITETGQIFEDNGWQTDPLWDVLWPMFNFGSRQGDFGQFDANFSASFDRSGKITDWQYWFMIDYEWVDDLKLTYNAGGDIYQAAPAQWISAVPVPAAGWLAALALSVLALLATRPRPAHGA